MWSRVLNRYCSITAGFIEPYVSSGVRLLNIILQCITSSSVAMKCIVMHCTGVSVASQPFHCNGISSTFNQHLPPQLGCWLFWWGGCRWWWRCYYRTWPSASLRASAIASRIFATATAWDNISGFQVRWLTFNPSSTCHLQNIGHNQPNQPYFCCRLAESPALIKKHKICLCFFEWGKCYPLKFGSDVGGTGSGVEKVRDLQGNRTLLDTLSLCFS